MLSYYKGYVSAISGWSVDAKIDKNFRPPCKTSYLKMPVNFLQRVFDKFIYLFIPLIKLFIVNILKKEKPNVVMIVMNGNPEFLIAGYKACKKLNIPYFIHVHDLWQENAKTDREKLIANIWEKKILEDSYKIFCTTEKQIEWYSKKYGMSSLLLPHTIKDKNINEKSYKITKSKIKNIVYSGNISHQMNLDIMQKLVASVEYLPRNIKLKIFTSWNIDTCKKFRVFNERIDYMWLPNKDVKLEINKSDLLLLPLSFENCIWEEVETVFATKTLDYLVSGVPILVIAPKNSYHSISAKTNGWGKVINDDDPKVIASNITELIDDSENNIQYVKNAFKESSQRRSSIHADRLLAFVHEIP